jgi:hypothetical protein
MRIFVPALASALLLLGFAAVAPLPAAAQSQSCSDCRTYTGTLEVDVTIDVQSKIRFTGISCSADFVASSLDQKSIAANIEETAVAAAENASKTGGGDDWDVKQVNADRKPVTAAKIAPPGGTDSSKEVVATAKTDSSGESTCKILIPYSWTLPGNVEALTLKGSLSIVIFRANSTTGVETPIRTNGQAIIVSRFPEGTNKTTKFPVKVTM